MAKKAQVSAEEVRLAMRHAREQLVEVQKDITQVLHALDKDKSEGFVDVTFTVRDTLIELDKTFSERNPKSVTQNLIKVVKARLKARAAE
jgi:allophanate hydrolase subunit 1